MSWSELTVAVVAAYGAILSTYTVISSRIEKRRQIKVEMSFGWPTYGPNLGATSVFVTASNTGHRPVTLGVSGLRFPGRKKATMLRPQSTVSFPHELTEGKSCTVWMEAKDLAEQLRESGFSGKVKLVGWFQDQVGKTYTSRPWKFDIDQSYEE